jgi:hypothetical protein
MDSNTLQKQREEETLDPVDWSEFRQFAHKVLDDAIDYASSAIACSGGDMGHVFALDLILNLTHPYP